MREKLRGTWEAFVLACQADPSGAMFILWSSLTICFSCATIVAAQPLSFGLPTIGFGLLALAWRPL